MRHKKQMFVTKLTAKLKDKKIAEFVTALYDEVPEDELQAVNQEHILRAVESTYKIFKTREAYERKVNIFIPSVEADLAVLEISCKDIPFLIDSVINELKSQQCGVHLIAHPVLSVVRDGSGNFKGLSSKGAKESLMQIHIANLYDTNQYLELKKRIEKILETIAYAVEDWRAITSRAIESINMIQTSQVFQVHELKDESMAFLEWLVNNQMVFLGFIEYKLSGAHLLPIDSTRLGVTKSSIHKFGKLAYDEQFQSNEPVFIRKWDERSVVHRTSHMDWIIVKNFDANGKCTGANMFFGLFTSSVYYQSVRNIPLMRKKIASVVQRYGHPENSHNYKELLTAMESFPRGELLKMSIDELYETATAIVKLSLIPRVKVFIRRDQSEKFFSCMVFIPEVRFSAEARDMIERIVCQHINGTVSKKYIQISDSGLARVQFILKTTPESIRNIDIEKLERDIVSSISIWSDDLLSALQEKLPKKEALTVYNKYKDAFDVKYRTIFRGNKAIHDINLIEEATKTNRVLFDIYISKAGAEGKQLAQFKIYSPDAELALSSTLPVIENMGLFAQDVYTYKIEIDGTTPREVYIHHFRLGTSLKAVDKYEELRGKLRIAFEKVKSGNVDDDKYNSLIITANINWREVILIRAIAKYLRQTDFPYSYELILEILLQHAHIVQRLVEIFNLKFNPVTQARNKTIAAVNAIIAEIKAYIKKVSTVAEDVVLTGFLAVTIAMKRTNYFQKDDDGEYKDYLSFKLSSQEIPSVPKPKPYAEIFVYSTHFEAIHLRGGKVARGGLRWSDRKEDFRTEILGLMKAQMTKNSVIVPVGSKGGFVLKKVSLSDGRDEFMNEGVRCYKAFLSGMLDITDNIVRNKVTPPKDVVRYDDDDPYLVVAADKGTATFSDYANAVSEKYGFWLGDAFASGGSAGYDHKKMGITAKGAWISVKQHFEGMGVDINKQTFTCVGIGDMSGDVFGNGMLLSKNMLLVAAFNHAHIFIDPTPDPKASFKERLRLFNKPRSQWTDYNNKLISRGGGVYDRKAKSISITPEVRAILGIEDTELSPDNLIRAILLAPVDLLWNGGIGTYVKSTTESNSRIGDKANDALRVNGSALRCKIIGEGGNLGMTQLGRIEYARKGGRLNTDAIDNSAGVDCSDHEVNLKIATSDMLLEGKMKRKDRDAMLMHMTDEVANLVLMDNYKQTNILTLETQGRYNRTSLQAWLIKYLEHRGELERNIEYLPSQEDLNQLITEKKRLTRPEVSVVLAYGKNSAFNVLVKHDLTNTKLLDNHLVSYFPKEFSKKYPNLIEKHKLKNEILATVLVNDFVNTLGCAYFHQLVDDLGASPANIIKAYVMIKEIFNIDKYWKMVERIPSHVPVELKIELFNELQQLIERNLLWLLNQVDMNNIEAFAKVCSANFATLGKKLKHVATHTMLEELQANLLPYAASKDLAAVAHEIFTLKLLTPAFDIISIAQKRQDDIITVAKIFFHIGEMLSLSWLLAQAKTFVARQYFQSVALRSLIAEMFEIHEQLTLSELANKKKARKSVLAHCESSMVTKYNSFIDDLRTGDTTDAFISKMTIAVKKVRAFLYQFPKID